ncbi:MAG: DedA family protein [Thermoflexibacteraceae bacterium]|jgi:membrane-associated protein
MNIDTAAIMDFFQFLLNSKEIIDKGGLIAITLIVFAETGLFFCFFLPGDYLLFLAGVFWAERGENLFLLLACIMGAAIMGNYTGYFFGKKVGEKLYHRPDTLFFKRRYLESTSQLFLKYGGKSLVIGRFMPIIRTFAPILAGTSRMDFKEFTTYNLIGAFLWTVSLVASGFYLDKQFPQIKDYIEYIVLFFISITTITIIRAYLQIRSEQLKETQEKNATEKSPS